MLTAVEKIRQQLTGDPNGEPHFQHEGSTVIRWITGGIAPSVHVVFRQDGTEIAACCPQCDEEFGRFDATYGGGAFRQLAAIRETGHHHSCREEEE